MNQLKKLTSLDYLAEIADNNDDFIKEMIEMFIAQVPIFHHDLNEYYNSKEWLNLGKLAHKMKSSILMMGMKDLAEELKIFEDDAKQGIHVETYKKKISKFIEDTNLAVDELKLYLKNY